MTAVTIYEVAAEAGVSIATVSKVLSNTPYVSEATRERVLRAVERLGYVPNPAARSLTKGRTAIIGLLIPYAPGQLFADPHLLEIIHGIEETLNERDYNLLLATARRPHDPASAYGRLLRSRYLDGALVLETVGSEAVSQQLRQQQYPWVVVGYQLGDVSAPCVHSSDEQASRSVAAHLVAQGHQRISVLSADPRPSSFDLRMRGFTAELASHGLQPLATHWGDMTIESGYAAAPQLIGSPDRPSAIFALNDRMAVGLLRWAKEHGVQVPAELSIVGFDDIQLAAMSDPGLTTVRQPAFELGQAATRLLFDLLDGANQMREVEVPAELIVRGTSGPAPAEGR